MPPLSGFVGKLLILDATRDLADVWVIWAMILATSLVAIVGLSQAGSVVFWKTDREAEAEGPTPALPLVACFSLLGGVVALAVFAGPVMRYIEATAAQLHAPAAYIAAVLGQG